MSDSKFETEKRLRLAEQEAERFRDLSLGTLIAGSVAYAPNLNGER